MGKTKQAEEKPALTPRERQTVQLVWAGHTNALIGAKLKVSVKTVEAHRSSVMKKWRTNNTAQMLRVAMQEKILEPA